MQPGIQPLCPAWCRPTCCRKLIPDPFYGDNESRLQWIGLTDWEYQTTFRVGAATLARHHVELVFDGLDTFASRAERQAVLAADNMFRTLARGRKTAAEARREYLRVVFRSPVTEHVAVREGLPYILPSVSTPSRQRRNLATAPYTRKAPYQYGWDWGPRYITIGIWKPVRLETWDGLRIENFHIHQLKITPRWRIGGRASDRSHQGRYGDNRYQPR